MIKGHIERYISADAPQKESYFGGNVDAFDTNNGIIGKAYHSDINSQFPNAMINEMPIGNPVFSSNCRLVPAIDPKVDLFTK